MAAQKGFLDSLGIGSTDERAIYRKTIEEAHPISQRANLGARLGAGARPLLGAAIGAGYGLANPGDDSRWASMRQGVKEGIRAINDIDVARASGITPEQLRSRRKMREQVAQIPNDGSYEGRIAAARRIAKLAQNAGDMEVMGNALAMISQLQNEQAQFEGLQQKNRAEEYMQDVTEEVGYDARRVTDDAKEIGKAVRIMSGPDAGRYRYIDKNGNEEVVDGGELVISGITGKATKAAKWQSLGELTKLNGASPSKIPQMRAAMTDMRTNAAIVTNIAEILLSANDPQGVLAQSGKAAIAADKAISFGESLYYVFRPPGASKTVSDEIHWEEEGGKVKRMSAQQQYERATSTAEDGILVRWLKRQGIESLDDALPSGIRRNSTAAEQYWANVMQLAFIDARMHEPSNRGLSDKDIEAALQRIGAATANPVSFAIRQIEVIETQLLPQLRNLGNEFTTFDSEYYEKEDIIDAVYDPTLRRQVEDTLYGTLGRLKEVVAQGRHGKGVNPPAAGPGAEDVTDAERQSTFEELGLIVPDAAQQPGVDNIGGA